MKKNEQNTTDKIKELEILKEEHVLKGNYHRAADIRDEISKIRDKKPSSFS